jgi:hypothetical protein
MASDTIREIGVEPASTSERRHALDATVRLSYIPDRIMAPYPQGAIALVEPGIAHRDFLEAARPRYAMLKYHHANRLLKAGETAESWFPDETRVITTTNVIDHRNATIPLEHNGHRRGEIDIVREFGPDYHIPADRPDYVDMGDAERYESTKECMVGTVAMANLIADAGLDTRVIPFVKTATPAERELAYRTIDQLGMDYAAVYCNQYFNDGRGVLIDELLEDLDVVAREGERVLDRPLRLFTVSLQPPNAPQRAPLVVEEGVARDGAHRNGDALGADTALALVFQAVDHVVPQHRGVHARVVGPRR